jgi:hypothetical protein
MDPSSPGVFVATAEKVRYGESSVGVVVLIRTFDANGDTSEARQFSFYCSRLIPSCVSVYGDSPVAFRPFELVNISRIEQSTPVMLVPYSNGDFTNMLSAMEAFATPFVPSNTILEANITLVLAFSKNLDDFPNISEHVAGVQAAVAAQNESWTKYFHSEVRLFSCNNTEEEDQYDPSKQGTIDEFGEVIRWVEGPNRQFEKMMRWAMENIPNAMIFMKEFDTVPQMDNHYINLLNEIQENEPFYMLGR